MTEDAKTLRKAYKAAWNRANKEKVRAANKRYWERKAQQLKEQHAREKQEE